MINTTINAIRLQVFFIYHEGLCYLVHNFLPKGICWSFVLIFVLIYKSKINESLEYTTVVKGLTIGAHKLVHDASLLTCDCNCPFEA